MKQFKKVSKAFHGIKIKTTKSHHNFPAFISKCYQISVRGFRSSHPKVLGKKGVLENFNKIAGLRPRQRCVLVNFAKFLKILFLSNSSRVCFLWLKFYNTILIPWHKRYNTNSLASFWKYLDNNALILCNMHYRKLTTGKENYIKSTHHLKVTTTKVFFAKN